MAGHKRKLNLQAARVKLLLHHVCVYTSVGAPGAMDLLEAGLVEGSSNTHHGQGTANRRFFFESGFLELLWVHDELEARSTPNAPTRLWERWVERDRAANPFGICFSSPEGLDTVLPFPVWTHRPDYLAGERCLLFAENLPLSEPEIFVLSWPQAPSPPATEPIRNSIGLCEMRSVSVGLPDSISISSSLRRIRDLGLVKVHRSATPELVVEFTSQREAQRRVPALGISMVGRPSVKCASETQTGRQ